MHHEKRWLIKLKLAGIVSRMAMLWNRVMVSTDAVICPGQPSAPGSCE